MAPVPRLARGSGSCQRCDQSGRTCPSCTQRRRLAWRLVDQQGHTLEQVAATLGLPPARVRELVEDERDRRELETYRLDSIPVTRAHAFLEYELARDPGLTRAEVAHRLGVYQADFDRTFGYAPAKHGAMQSRVGIATASRLVRALGRAPHELEGC
jgi:plasmid maintenance system antidote protein VapI